MHTRNATMNGNLSANGESIAGRFQVFLGANIKQYVLIVALAVLWLIFTILTKGIFVTARNLSNLLVQTSVLGVLSCGMVMVIVGGQIDLSIGSIAGVLAAVVALLQRQSGAGTLVSILIAFAIGMTAGLINGYWVARWNIAPFIVTLGTSAIFRGLIYGLLRGRTVGPLHDSFALIGQGYLPQILFKDVPFNDTSVLFAVAVIVLFIIADFRKRNQMKKYGFRILSLRLEILKVCCLSIVILAACSITIFYRGVPFSVLTLLAVVLVVTYVAKNTLFGSHIYAMGGNREAAILSGINVRKNVILLFVFMGFICAIGGILYTARLNAASPGGGLGLEFAAITAVIIGGTSFHGGEGNIPGAMIGSLLMGTLDNGMSLMNLGVEYQTAVGGLVLLIALWADSATKKRVQPK